MKAVRIREATGIIMFMLAGGYADALAQTAHGTFGWMVSPRFLIVIALVIAGRIVFG